jgi:hypothetical protein
MKMMNDSSNELLALRGKGNANGMAKFIGKYAFLGESMVMEGDDRALLKGRI